MSAQLEELCDLVADCGLSNALKLQGRFQHHLADEANQFLATDASQIVLLGFIFMNWAIANGAWSNLTSTKLRRDLMAASKNALVVRSASRLSKTEGPDDAAVLATSIDYELVSMMKGYIKEMEKAAETGASWDANGALFYALDWIQTNAEISDSAMNRVVPRFLAESTDFAEVENIAAQLNRAADDRKKKGFLARFFEP